VRLVAKLEHAAMAATPHHPLRGSLSSRRSLM